jgi:hypothetical protein
MIPIASIEEAKGISGVSAGAGTTFVWVCEGRDIEAT